MRDAEVVASIVAGDPAGLAEAYDRYADPLYAYCWFILDGPADAAEAVRDTFLLAAARLNRLRDPERLRAWLYAAARNECLRSLTARRAAFAPGRSITTIEDDDAERAELRAVVRSALCGLGPREREAVDLRFGHGLTPAEVALVLGVPGNRANALLSRAGKAFQACLGVVLAARAGRGDCIRLNIMFSTWAGRLTVPLRKQALRHMRQCATCASRRGAELRRATQFETASGGALTAMVSEPARLAGGAPDGLRDHVLWMTTSEDAEALAQLADVRSRAREFGRDGFPRPLPLPASGWYRSRRGKGVLTVGVTAAVVAAAVTLALTSNWQPAAVADPHSGSNASALPTIPDAASAGTTAAPPTATPSASATTETATAPALTDEHPATRPSPTTTTSPPAVRGSTPVPSTPPATQAPPSPSPTPVQSSSPPTPGTLAVSPDVIDLSPYQPSATVTLTAENGPVSWSIAQATGPAGAVAVYPADGTLAAGDIVQVTVDAQYDGRFSAELVVSPGGQTVTVVYRAGHG